MITRCSALALAAVPLLEAPALGQTPLPSGTIAIVTGFPAGGASDALARLVAEKLRTLIDRPVIVENRVGASGRIAVDFVKRAPPDGTRLLFANIAMMVLGPLTTPDDRLDPERDFAPVTLAADFSLSLATGPMTGTRDLAALTAWLRANPDRANYGVPAVGSLPHLYGLEYGRRAGIALTMVPYRGGNPLASDLIGGQVAVGLSATADFAELHKAGRLRIVAVSGTERSPGVEDVPTFAEQAFAGFEDNGWSGFFLPAGTPVALVAAYHRAIVGALAMPDVSERLTRSLGFIVRGSSPEAFGARLAADLARYRPLIEEAGLRQ